MQSTRLVFSCLTLFLLVCLEVRASETETVLGLEEQEGVAVTIYNENLALVKDRRRLTLAKGTASLAFREVSARLRPETALMRAVSGKDSLRVIEQNFDFDLLTPHKLLEKYVGRTVGLVKVHPTTGEETVEEATVLSTNNGVVLRIGDRIETGPPGRLIYSELPANLRDRPTLTMLLDNRHQAPQVVELSYLTSGLGWQADYVAELAPAEDSLDLNGWVTLTNTSGATYRQARVQLMAGDVHQVKARPQRRAYMEDARVMAAAAPQMEEEGLMDYHLYTLAHPTTIKENQTKQVALLQAAGVVCRKEYLLEGGQYYYQERYADLGTSLKAGVYLIFDNRKEDNLGLPLPKGVMRVYKRDSKGAVQFVGEDRIDHTPENNSVRLKLGNAFDVTAEKKQTDFKKIAGSSRYNYIFESSYSILLKNAKEEPVTVKVLEPLPGDWQILAESHPHSKVDASRARWMVPVPAKGETEMTYRVRVRF